MPYWNGTGSYGGDVADDDDQMTLQMGSVTLQHGFDQTMV